jgi:Type III secretion protein (HpaP)
MRAVARVRLNLGSRSAAALGDGQAAALRQRFEHLLHGSGQGVPAVSHTVPAHDAPLPWASRSAGLDAPTMQAEAAPWVERIAVHNNEPAPPSENTPDRQALSRSGTSPVEPTAGDAKTKASCAAQPQMQMQTHITPPPAPGLLAHAQNAPAPMTATPPPNAASQESAAPSAAGRAAENNEPAAALPPTAQAALFGRAEMQAPPQPPTRQPLRARGERDDLPALVRELVQAVVHMSRGRDGQWRLTMALKPQVLEGTLVALAAEPGRLQVRFDCAGADAAARLVAVRDDLRLRLVEAVSAARPVDVRVDVQRLTQTTSHGLV